MCAPSTLFTVQLDTLTSRTVDRSSSEQINQQVALCRQDLMHEVRQIQHQMLMNQCGDSTSDGSQVASLARDIQQM